MSKWMEGLLEAEAEFKQNILNGYSVNDAFDKLMDSNRERLDEWVPKGGGKDIDITYGRVDFACHINYLRLSGRIQYYVEVA